MTSSQRNTRFSSKSSHAQSRYQFEMAAISLRSHRVLSMSGGEEKIAPAWPSHTDTTEQLRSGTTLHARAGSRLDGLHKSHTTVQSRVSRAPITARHDGDGLLFLGTLQDTSVGVCAR